ncbi:MAG: sporulation protein [Hyphomicrobium sp.]|nr:MAG: sporulation protein [Hyphomicrobium sp.]PPC98616.1 MAG: sporulation protein [Hyphomicrobium sp.]
MSRIAWGQIDLDQISRGVCAVALAGLFALALPGSFAVAQQKKSAEPPSPAAEKQAAKEAASRAYDGGLKSFQSGKYQPAVDQLSTALRGGGLASGDMARALYTRGLAYKRQNKPGLAISDLTSALWLKNGLIESDRQAAMAERADAYKMAGLGDGPAVPDSVVAADPNKGPDAPRPVTKAEAKAQTQAPIQPAASAPSGEAATSAWSSEPTQQVTRQQPDSEKAQEAARARKLAAAPVDSGGLDSAAVATLVRNDEAAKAAAPVPQAAPAPQQTALAATSASAWETTAAPASGSAEAPALSALPTEPSSAPAASSSVASSVSGFFSNMFGGGSSSSSAPATVTAAAPAPAAPWTSPDNPSSLTTASTSAAPPVSKAQPVTSVAKAPAPKPAVKGGKYKLHIAAVRSRPEAESLAQQLAQAHAADFNSRSPTVDEAVIGTMGTFYRVRVGGYPNAEESRGICNKLRTSGFDCLVVTN